MAYASAQNSTALISIIIPVYNVEAYLARCLESVTSQTYSNLEIILVNDGSTDGSAGICDAWAGKDSRIKVIHQKNMGLAAARNTGLDIATGDYILFVDSDDYVADDLISVLLKEMSSDADINCVLCGVSFVDDHGITAPPQAVSSPIVLCGMDAIKDQYLYQRVGMNIVNTWGKLYCKELWRHLRFTDGIYYEDLDIMPYVFSKCQKVACVPNIGYYYYQRPESLSHGTGHDDKRVIDSLLIRDKHSAFYKTIGQHELASAVSIMLIDLIITSDSNGWIPESHTEMCRQLVNKHWSAAVSASSAKNRLRYFIYRYCGIRVYKLFVRQRIGAYL